MEPAPAPSAAAPGIGPERKLVETLARISRTGGLVQFTPPPQAYGFQGGSHVNTSQELQGSLWRFRLTTAARDVLDHLTVEHDEHGIVAVTQTQLAQHFGHGQATISRALHQLAHHHFVWKVRRGHYRLHPLFAYRFSSRKHTALLQKLGQATLAAHQIVIPLPETRS
ncbi:hypothetical protein OG897_32280 [Streptomyces sp. NBC_00237]|uniref:hypothetical protein n=1 Tax=Streptomyces sp. NBC_00237 TaxID=2975687 RepID=UPI0022562505|nr:hypothetical protein [Streptomyces sp. NBC_00237]MCX5206080.1 hypothetical protein [Streptomyces sp. NBC_00237]